MDIKQQSLGNRTMITIVVVVLLCGAGLAYSQGWFNSLNSSIGMESNRDGTEQLIEHEGANSENAGTTPAQTAPASTPVK